MKTSCTVLVLCLVLSCASCSQESGLRKLLKDSPSIVSVHSSTSCIVINGHCVAKAKVSIEAINAAAISIATAFASAVASVEDGGDVVAQANAFAVAVAEAYAYIISKHVLSVFVKGKGEACAYTKSQGAAYAEAIAQATAQAISSSSNKHAAAFADCIAEAIAVAQVRVTQNAFFGTCVKYGYDFIKEEIVSIGFAQAIAEASAYAFTQIKNNVPIATASCISKVQAVTSTTSSG